MAPAIPDSQLGRLNVQPQRIQQQQGRWYTQLQPPDPIWQLPWHPSSCRDIHDSGPLPLEVKPKPDYMTRYVCVLVTQSCLTLCDLGLLCPWNSPGKNTAISVSRGSSWPRDQTQVSSITGRSCIAGRCWATREALDICIGKRCQQRIRNKFQKHTEVGCLTKMKTGIKEIQAHPYSL